MGREWTVVALFAVACSGATSGDGDGGTGRFADAGALDAADGADAGAGHDAEVPPTGDAAMGDAGGEPEPCVGRMIDVAEGGDLTPAIEAAVGDGEIACLPEGRFTMSPLDLSGAGWQVTGAGIDRTVIALPSGFHGFLMRLAGREWQMGGMTIDVDSESDGWSTNAIPRFLLRGDDWRLHDLRLKGTTGPNGDAHEPIMNIQDVGAGATARFDNVIMLDGSAPAGEGSNVSAYGAFGDWNVNGHLLFDRIQLSMWAENSLYVEGSHVTITNSFFHNTNVGVRIGGNTVVDNSVFLLDGPLPVQAWSGGSGMRGLWLNANAYYPGTIRVTNSDFTMSQAIVKGYSGASVDYIELENLTVVGNIDVLGDGVIRDSCVDGSVDGIATEGLRTGCSPRTTAP